MSAKPRTKAHQRATRALRKATTRKPRKAPTIPHLRALSDLSEQRRHFVLAYCGLAGGDLLSWWQGAPAARAAGYSAASAKHTALELLGDPTVRAAIDEVKAWLDRQNDDQRRAMLERVRAIAFDPMVRPGTQLRAIELYLRAIGHLQDGGVQVGISLPMSERPRAAEGEGISLTQLSRVRAVMGFPTQQAIEATASEGPKPQNQDNNQRRSEAQAIAKTSTRSNGHARDAKPLPADDDEPE